LVTIEGDEVAQIDGKRPRRTIRTSEKGKSDGR
jgi:hypothetical protein